MIQTPTVSPTPIPWTDTASKHTALALGIFGLIGIGIRVCSWIRKRRKDRRDRKDALQNTLDSLCRGQTDIYEKLEQMDRARDAASEITVQTFQRVEEKQDIIVADVRVAVSGIVTALDGLIQLGNGTGVKVNGPVLRLRDKLQDRIEEGIGGPHPSK